MRYEVALETTLELASSVQRDGSKILRPTDPLKIHFQGRDLVWHPGTQEICPVVTIMLEDGDDYRGERLIMDRFLSALTYFTGAPLYEITNTASSSRGELGPPMLDQPRAMTLIRQVGAELIVTEDQDLVNALGLYREGVSSRSSALEFLSFWKVAELAVGEKGLEDWIKDRASKVPQIWFPGEEPPNDWHRHFKSSRIAAAHAVPRGKKTFKIDPDVPEIRLRLARDANLMRILAGQAIEERWPKAVVSRGHSHALTKVVSSK